MAGQPFRIPDKIADFSGLANCSARGLEQIWVVSPFFSFAEYSLLPWPFVAGVLCLVAGLWWFHRSHSDLGRYWSVTLELRENHRLITEGVYRHVSHPMYAALFLYSIGQALVVPNWVAGPSYFVTFGISSPFVSAQRNG